MAICSGVAELALGDVCTVGGGADGRHSPACSERARTPARPGHTPRAPRAAPPSGLSPGRPFPRRVCPGRAAARPAHLSRLMARARGPRRSSGFRICSPPSPAIPILTFKPRGRARPGARPEPAWSAECAGPRAPLGLPRRRLRRRGERGAHRAPLRQRKARLGASPSKAKAAPGAEPRGSLPA